MSTATDRDNQNLKRGLPEIWCAVGALEKQSSLSLWLQYMLQVWRSIVTSPLTSFLTVMTVALGVLVLSSFLLAFQNLETGLALSRGSVELSIFLKDTVESDMAVQLKGELEARPEVDSVLFRDKDAALDILRNEFGDQAVLLDGLDRENNPLPVSFEVTLKEGKEADSIFEELVETYRDHPSVDFVHYDEGTLNQLKQLLLLVKQIGFFGICVLFVILGVIIANTIKLAIHVHRQEIEIMHLVGAEGGFIRIPFVIEGVVHGCVGALLGLLMLYPFVVFLQRYAEQSILLKAILPHLNFLGFWICLVVVVVSGLVGLLSALLGVRRVC